MCVDTKQTILIVEDDADLRRILQFQLQSEGFEVVEAENGAVAWELIRTSTYDCILLDLMMPEMDGFNFLKRMRVSPASMNTPVIVLTAADDRRNRTRSDQYMADAFMSKPYDLEKLTGTIRNLTARASSETI